MIKSSKFCAFFIFLWNSFLSSCFYNALVKIVCFFADSFSQSKTRKLLIGKSEIEDFSDTSVFYNLISKLSDGIILFLKNFCKLVSTGYSTSFVKRIYDRFFEKSFGENYTSFVCFISVFIFVIPHNFWSNTFGLFFAGILFVLYIIALSTSKNELKPDYNPKTLWFSMLVFIFSICFSCYVSYDVADSIRVLLFFITSFVICFVLYATITDEKSLETVCKYMYYALIVTAIFAFVQKIIGVEADAALTDMDLNKDMPGRVFSTLANPNNYAEFLVLFMPYSLAYALNLPLGRKRTLHIFGMLLPLGAILLTYSRSGWIALAIASVVFVSLYDKKLIPVFIVLAIFAIPFIPKNILNRILTIGNLEDSSSSYRVDIWTGCLKMLKEYWFTGVGLGTGGFADIYPQYAVGESGVAPHSHMHFMEMLCELGLLGFISYLCMTVTLIKRSFVAAARSVPKNIRNVAIASAAAMTGIVLIGCFEYCWFYPRVMFAFFMCAGVTLGTVKLAKQTKQ